jgi:hypothetical protein
VARPRRRFSCARHGSRMWRSRAGATCCRRRARSSSEAHPRPLDAALPTKTD